MMRSIKMEEMMRPSSNTNHELLISCGELIVNSSPAVDLGAARRLLSEVSAESSPYGDSRERLSHHLGRALQRRVEVEESDEVADCINTSASYLTLNQITPFLRFAHLTANQAILDSLGDSDDSLHVVDLDVMHGLQWPPFMQALAERRPTPISLRISAAGHDLPLLTRTGDRLHRFADSLGLRFRFHPLPLPPDADAAAFDASALSLLPGEPLAVNCVLCLHRLLRDRPALARLLRSLRGLRPRVLALAERQADFGRFADAVAHYAAVFDSLEATLPASSRERLAVEQVWLSSEICAAVSPQRSLRSQRYEAWEGLLRSCGFSEVALSPYAVSQAKLLLRLHYPSEGYQLHILNHHNCLFLAWQNRPLFSLSSWH